MRAVLAMFLLASGLAMVYSGFKGKTIRETLQVAQSGGTA